MSEKNKIEFEVKKDDKDVKVVVLKATRKDEQDSEMEYNRVYTELFRKKHLLSAEVDKVARERSLWDDTREDKGKEIVNFLKEGAWILSGNVPGVTKAEARKTAIEMRKKRNELENLQSERSELHNKTAESAAQTASFHFKMYRCTKYAETNKLVWGSVDAMLESGKDDPIYPKAFEAMLEVNAGVDPKHYHKRPENKFLLEHNMCNSELRLIDAATNGLVDEDNKPIDEKGRYINAEGQLINDAGRAIDEDGNLIPGENKFLD